jgi:hypothetical protein
MKLTNEDLRRIILEEIQDVLSEDFPQLGDDSGVSLVPDEEDQDKLDPISSNDFEKGVRELYDKLRKDSEFKKQFKPTETAQIMDIMAKALSLGADEDGDRTVLLKKANAMLTKAVEQNS